MSHSVTGAGPLRHPGGRPRKYPVQLLAVGEYMIIPWGVDDRGVRLPDQGRIYCAVRQEARRYAKRFECKPVAAGVHVRRVQ